MALRRGEWPEAEALAWAHRVKRQLQAVKSPLPNFPDVGAIERDMIQIHEEFWDA